MGIQNQTVTRAEREKEMATEQEMNEAVLAGDYQLAERIGHTLDGQAATRRPTLLGAALWYTQNGIPVFPCVARQKRPLTRKGLYDATLDEAQVRVWWEQWPGANIGTPCGHAFDVIDCDGPEGIASLAPDIDQLRPHLIGVVSTPRPGGMHYYIPAKPERRNAAKYLPGVDVRAFGGYVILPPSSTDEHGPGRSYRWLRPLTIPTAGEVAA